jgi:hypothetical protein
METKQILIELDNEIEKLTYVRSLLAGSNSTERVTKRRKMSAEARERIADAQRKRWAKAKRLKKLPGKTKAPIPKA